MNILFFSHLVLEFPDIIYPLEQKQPGYRFIYARSREEYRQALPDTEVLVASNPSKEEILMAPGLKLLIIPFSGSSHIDFAFFRKQGIMVANAPGNGLSVAERALALAMAICGRVVEFHNDMGKGNWHRTGNPHKPLDYWFTLSGRNVSILGTGDIGRNIAKLLQGFECTILGYRRGREVPRYFNSVTADLAEALEFGDIVFVCLPASPSTEKLVNSSNIGKLKGKYLVNVGRGSVIEEQALYDSLASGKGLAGAGIDVWYDYPSKTNRKTTGSKLPFHTLPNVVMSPHAGSHSIRGKRGQLEGVAEALASYLENGVPSNLLGKQVE